MPSFTQLLFKIFTAISLRLQGPSSANGTGRVEVFFAGQWGTICDDYWDLKDATVVCRQLGYISAVRALRGSSVQAGSGKIWLDNVHCKGSEQNLDKCPHSEWSKHDCNHYEDAGVECESTGNYTLTLIGYFLVFKKLGRMPTADQPNIVQGWKI